jgi:hypothetical protein
MAMGRSGNSLAVIHRRQRWKGSHRLQPPLWHTGGTLHDNVAPARVANHVWARYLKHKPGRNRYWIMPTADHYIQCDTPRQLAQVIRLTVKGDEIPLQTMGNRPDGAVLVDQSSSSCGST